MSNNELKELIYSLENILKQDKRFKKNGDNKYKKNIKTLYINALQNKNNLNNFTYIKTTCPKVEPTIYPKVEPIICPKVEPTICPKVEPTICPKVEPENNELEGMNEIYDTCMSTLHDINNKLDSIK